MRRWAARAGLVLIAAAILFGIYLPRANNDVWPLPHHPHLLLGILVIFGFIGLGGLLLFVLAKTVLWLWERAW